LQPPRPNPLSACVPGPEAEIFGQTVRWWNGTLRRHRGLWIHKPCSRVPGSCRPLLHGGVETLNMHARTTNARTPARTHASARARDNKYARTHARTLARSHARTHTLTHRSRSARPSTKRKQRSTRPRLQGWHMINHHQGPRPSALRRCNL
jgi:hypothetical protein